MRLLSILLCILVVLPWSAFGGDSTVVKLGALYNLTGAMAPIDSTAYRGSKLAAKLVNENGGVPGKGKLELVVMDTKTVLDDARKDAAKLVAIPVVAGLGYGDTDYALAAAPQFQAKSIPFLTVGATDPSLPEKVGGFMFMTPFGDNDQAHAMADFAYNKLKAKRIAMWTNSTTDFTRVLAGFFKERCLDLGGKIVAEESFKPGAGKLPEMAAKLKRLSPAPEAVFISGNPGDAIPTVSALRKAGVTLPILSGDGFDSDLLTRLPNPKDAEGVYFASHAYFQSHRAEVKRFVKAYTAEYGKPPENSYAALGYDSVNLLADALARAKNATGKALAQALNETTHFKGVSGDLSFTRPGRVPIATVHIIRVKDGKYTQIARWNP